MPGSAGGGGGGAGGAAGACAVNSGGTELAGVLQPVRYDRQGRSGDVGGAGDGFGGGAGAGDSAKNLDDSVFIFAIKSEIVILLFFIVVNNFSISVIIFIISLISVLTVVLYESAIFLIPSGNVE